MAKFSFRPAMGACTAFSLALVSGPAFAGGFTPEGAQHWVTVAHALNEAANGTTEQMGAACQGVSLMGGGSEIRKESSQVPKWAVMAHFDTCIAYQSISSREGGKGRFMSSTDPCKNIKAAIGELGKAQPGTDPAEVAAAAGELKATLTSLVADYKDAKTCKFGKVGMF